MVEAEASVEVVSYFQAARQLCISERLLYHWRDQQAAAEVVSAALAHAPEVCAALPNCSANGTC